MADPQPAALRPARDAPLGQRYSYHLSLSRTVALRQPQIPGLTAALAARLKDALGR